MKKFAYAPLAILLAIVPQVQAGDMGGEVVPFGYLKMHFGSASSQQDTTYGFSLAQTNSSASGMNMFDSERPPLLNLQFKGDELDALKLNGLDVLDKQVTYNVDGTTTTSLGINWNYALAGVAIAAGLSYFCARNDWDNLCDDDDEEPSRYQETAP